jgi:hypothetical protein
LAQLTQGGQSKMAGRVFRQVSGSHGIDLGHDRGGAKPINHFEFVAGRWSGMGRRLGNDESRTETPFHGFRNADDVMSARGGISGSAEVVRASVSSEIEFLKFRTVTVPLKNDRFPPVMPDRCADDNVLVDKEVAFVRSLS